MSAMPRLLHLPLAAITAALLCSCAAGPTATPPEEPVTWEMTQKAEASYRFMQFETAQRLGQHDKAIAAIDRLLELSPTPRVFLEGANFYWSQNDVGTARTLLKQGIELHPENRDLVLTLATTYFAEKRFDAAAVTIEDYLTRHPDDWGAQKELAVVLIESKHFARALDVLKRVPDDSRDASMLYYSAKASAGLGLNRQAIGKLYRAVELKPEFVEAWAEMAYLFEVERDYVAAEETYNRILELGETSGEVWLRLIDLNLKMNNPDKALSLFKQGPEDTQFALEAATMFLEEKFFDQAHTVLDPLPLDESEAASRVWFYKALLAYDGDQNPGKALSFLERIPREDVHHDKAIRFRVQLLVDIGKSDAALSLVEHEKEQNPDIKDYWLLEASIHETLGHNDEARKVLEGALSHWPKDTGLLYTLGIVQDKQGLRQEGIATMERIISINPEHADALNYVGYALAEDGEDFDRAAILINRALELKPESGYIIDSLAWLYYLQGDYAKAWEHIVRAVERVADDPTIWEHYGDIARAAGKMTKAREGYRNSLELNPGNPAVQEKLDAL